MKKDSPQNADSAAKPACEWSEKAQQFLHDEPAKAVGVALLGGMLLAVLPIGSLVSMIVRLAFSLARPALLIFGAVKLFEEFEKRKTQ